MTEAELDEIETASLEDGGTITFLIAAVRSAREDAWTWRAVQIETEVALENARAESLALRKAVEEAECVLAGLEQGIATVPNSLTHASLKRAIAAVGKKEGS